MANPDPIDDAQRELVEGLARGSLAPADRRRAERLLETSEYAREHFRRLTAGRFPTLPSYTILEQVGKGGFGVVYKAVHHAKERIEALKVLFSKTPLLTSYFENEVHLIARLRHPNIATLFDAQLTSPPLYYTMEFVEGERLNEALKSREFSLADRIEVVRKTALALDYAHREGVVHRDVKPQNILIDAQREPHLVDFGIAKRLELMQAEGEAPERAAREGPVGTVGFIAPEQLRGGAVDARTDVYSLGALLFQCVTGEPARQARDEKRCLALLRQRRIGAPEDLAAIIARCVEERPEARYESCAALAADLARYLAGRSIGARRDRPLLEQTGRIVAYTVRGYPLTLRASAVVLAAVALAYVLWGMGARTHAPVGTGGRTVIIAFTDDTRRAILDGTLPDGLQDVDPYDRFSLRRLHGSLMERLVIPRPLVVVWDYYFREPGPHDESFARGVRALREVGTPVVVGANFDINGEPEIIDAIRPEVSGVGTMVGVEPWEFADEYEVPAVIQRGYEPPIPSLIVSAFAAARFPDCAAQLEIDGSAVRLRYRKLKAAIGEPRRIAYSDVIPVQSPRPINERARLDPRAALALRVNDRAYPIRFKARQPLSGEPPVIEYQHVFKADERELRATFSNKAVVVGQMIPPDDQYPTRAGGPVFGCQVHAIGLDSLLAQSPLVPFGWRPLLWRTIMFSVVAGLVVTILPPRRGRTLRGPVLLALGGVVGALCLAVIVAARLTEAWQVEVGLGAAALMAAGGPAYLLKAMRDRLLELAPEAITYASTADDLSSTILAQSR